MYILILYVYVYPVLIFCVFSQTACLQVHEKFHVIYYVMFVKNKSESILVLNPKFYMNA